MTGFVGTVMSVCWNCDVWCVGTVMSGVLKL